MIEVGCHRLESAWWGTPGKRPSLVLLHEGLGCVALWRDFPQLLAEATGCAVFAWSRLGYGQSDPVTLPRPVSYMQDEAARLGCVLDAAGIGDCVLIGHSDGASIAAIYAGSVADPRMRGIVLISPHYFVEDMCLDSIAQARDAYPNGLRDRLARYHADVDGAFLGWNGAWLNPDFRAFDITGQLAAIRVPILQIQGSDDQYGTKAQTDAGERLAGATTVLLPAKHAPQFEATAPTLAAITAFVRKLEL